MTVWFKGFSAVGFVSGNRCESDWRSRGREFDPGPVPYFRGDWLWNNFYSHSPPFRWIIQEGLLSVSSERMCMKYWLACPGKEWLGELIVPPWPWLLTWDVKQQHKQTNPPPHTHTLQSPCSPTDAICTHIGQFHGIIELWRTFPNATNVPTWTLADLCCLLLTFANNMDQD